MNSVSIALLLLVMFGPLLVAALSARIRGAGGVSNYLKQLGAVTIAYTYPGTAVPAPTTLAQYNNFNTVVGTVVAGLAGDTQQIVTHMLNLPASDITAGWPITDLTPLGDATTGSWFQASSAPDYIVLQKGTAGTGPTTRFFIQSPHSMTR